MPEVLENAGEKKPTYTSRIIKATALIPDTKALLYAWDEAAPAGENLARIREENVLGKHFRYTIQTHEGWLLQGSFPTGQMGAAE